MSPMQWSPTKGGRSLPSSFLSHPPSSSSSFLQPSFRKAARLRYAARFELRSARFGARAKMARRGVAICRTRCAPPWCSCVSGRRAAHARPRAAETQQARSACKATPGAPALARCGHPGAARDWQLRLCAAGEPGRGAHAPPPPHSRATAHSVTSSAGAPRRRPGKHSGRRARRASKSHGVSGTPSRRACTAPRAGDARHRLHDSTPAQVQAHTRRHGPQGAPEELMMSERVAACTSQRRRGSPTTLRRYVTPSGASKAATNAPAAHPLFSAAARRLQQPCPPAVRPRPRLRQALLAP